MHPPDDHDLGLSRDLPHLLGRRRALTLLAGAGAVALVGCGSDGEAGSPASTTAPGPSSTTGATTATSAGTAPTAPAGSQDDCVGEIPEEIAGPFPGDGSNGPNVLTEAGVVRSDITTSFGSRSGTAAGVPLAIELTLRGAADCIPLEGAAIYLWHCDRDGGYSLYSQGVTDQNYLRGVQEASADGVVRFTSIFPAAYPGRWPHIHFEIYPSLDDATSASNMVTSSQLALPQEACDAVYSTPGYEASVGNLAQTSLQADMVFSDSFEAELAAVSGGVAEGFSARLTIGI